MLRDVTRIFPSNETSFYKLGLIYAGAEERNSAVKVQVVRRKLNSRKADVLGQVIDDSLPERGK